jgi:acyl dehydratase
MINMDGVNPQRIVRGRAELVAAQGELMGPSAWIVIDQAVIDAFAEVTRDHQWIHVDPERAAAGPFGATIAHGYLTASLVPYLLSTLRRIEGARMGVNYGLDRVRFPAVVRAGSKVRATAVVASIEEVGEDGVQVTTAVTVEAQGQAKPVCVLNQLARYYF